MKKIILRWTMRVLIAIFGIAVFLVLGLFAFLLFERHHLAQLSRTYERPLKLEGHALRLMNKLQTPQGDNSLKFIITSAFGDKWFAVAVTEKDGIGCGEVIVQPVARMDTHEGVSLKKPLDSGIIHRNFVVAPVDLQRFFRRWDDMSDDYSGEGRVWTDGARLSFERKRKYRIISGSGNSPCHYDALGDWAAQIFSGYAPELQELREPWLSQKLAGDTCNPSIFSLR